MVIGISRIIYIIIVFVVVVVVVVVVFVFVVFVVVVFVVFVFVVFVVVVFVFVVVFVVVVVVKNLLQIKCKGKNEKALLVQAMKAWGSIGIAPLIPNHGTRWR